MLVRLLNFKFTSTGLTDSDRVLFVPAPAAMYLGAALSGGNYTYLKISNGQCFEIVKVTKQISAGMFAIARAQEWTARLSFPPGSAVEYVDTQELFTRGIVPLRIYGSGSMEYSDSALRYRKDFTALAKDVRAVLTAKGK